MYVPYKMNEKGVGPGRCCDSHRTAQGVTMLPVSLPGGPTAWSHSNAMLAPKFPQMACGAPPDCFMPTTMFGSDRSVVKAWVLPQLWQAAGPGCW